jgi:hypothetical protein
MTVYDLVKLLFFNIAKGNISLNTRIFIGVPDCDTDRYANELNKSKIKLTKLRDNKKYLVINSCPDCDYRNYWFSGIFHNDREETTLETNGE